MRNVGHFIQASVSSNFLCVSQGLTDITINQLANGLLPWGNKLLPKLIMIKINDDKWQRDWIG